MSPNLILYSECSTTDVAGSSPFAAVAFAMKHKQSRKIVEAITGEFYVNPCLIPKSTAPQSTNVEGSADAGAIFYPAVENGKGNRRKGSFTNFFCNYSVKTARIKYLRNF